MKFPNRQIHGDRKYLGSFQGLGGKGKADGYGVSFRDDHNVLDTDNAIYNSGAILKTLSSSRKRVNFLVCEL